MTGFLVIIVLAATAAGLLLHGQPIPRSFVAYAATQHAPPAGPAEILTEIDNKEMTVLRVRLAPHEKTPMHGVSARLVVWLTDADLQDTTEDGTTTDYHRMRGAIDWMSPRRHAGENLSDKPIVFLAIVPKSSCPCSVDQYE